MTVYQTINSILSELKIPCETLEFKKAPQPDTFVVLTPISDDFDLYAGDSPTVEVNSVRINLYTKRNFIKTVRDITNALFLNDFSVTDRRLANFDKDTRYSHYAIECEKIWDINIENN